MIKTDVVKVVQEFFCTGKLLRQINATALVLMPKVEKPNRIQDYKPMACCSTLYKIIAKVLSVRLQRAFAYIIDPT